MSHSQRLADAIAEREIAQACFDDERTKDLFQIIAVLRTRIARHAMDALRGFSDGKK